MAFQSQSDCANRPSFHTGSPQLSLCLPTKSKFHNSVNETLTQLVRVSTPINTQLWQPRFVIDIKIACHSLITPHLLRYTCSNLIFTSKNVSLSFLKFIETYPPLPVVMMAHFKQSQLGSPARGSPTVSSTSSSHQHKYTGEATPIELQQEQRTEPQYHSLYFCNDSREVSVGLTWNGYVFPACFLLFRWRVRAWCS